MSITRNFAVSLAVLCSPSLASGPLIVEEGFDYLKYVTAYADTMLERGRDVYGKEHTPLFAAALDRHTMQLRTMKDFGEVPGVRNKDRSVTGANPQEDMALYELFYELSDLLCQPRYAQAADDALEYFFKHCQSEKTGLMAWGEHLYWDFRLDARADVWDIHEMNGEWPFWDRCYRLAPEASWQFALGLWRHQVADQATGDFSRHAKWSEHGPNGGADFPRYAGQMIVTWADAYGRSANARRREREELHTAIAIVLRRMEENMAATKTGRLPAFRGAAHLWPYSNLELARCLWKAAPHMDAELAGRMRAFALRLDEKFLSALHEVANPRRKWGFATRLEPETGEAIEGKRGPGHTRLWVSGYGVPSTADIANLCRQRHRQLAGERPELAEQYGRLILEAADGYVETSLDPKDEKLLKPGTLASVIKLLLSAYEMTSERTYLDKADEYGRISVALFLGDGRPLPQATSLQDHYETMTGGPELMLALFRLHGALAE